MGNRKKIMILILIADRERLTQEQKNLAYHKNADLWPFNFLSITTMIGLANSVFVVYCMSINNDEMTS